MKHLRLIVLTLTVLFLLLHIATPAEAHTRTEIGPYLVVVGWLQEPAIVGERNALYLEFTEDEEPVTGVEANLNAELQYGGAVFRANLTPIELPGAYIVELLPTVRGQYDVRLFGTIGETEVDVIIQPEEVFSAARLQFPEEEPPVRDVQLALQQEIGELENQVGSARLIAIAGVLTGLAGLIVAVLALLRSQQVKAAD
jgi:hypothetical protein